MTEVKKRKFTTWVIAILVLLNLGTLTIIALQNLRWKANKKPEVRSELSMRVLSRQLEFSDEQNMQLNQLRKQHFETIRPLMTNMRNTRNELFTQLNADAVNAEKVDSLTSVIGSLVAQQERLTFTHFNDIKAICTPEQLEKFNKFAGRIGAMLLPDRNRRPEQGRRGRKQDGRKGPPPPPPGG